MLSINQITENDWLIETISEVILILNTDWMVKKLFEYQPIAFISSRQLKFEEIRITTIVGVSVVLNQLQLYQLQIISVTTN